MRRFAFAPLAVLAAAVSVGAASPSALAAPLSSSTAATPLAASGVQRIVEPSALHPALIVGELSKPSSRPALEIAREVLATHASVKSAIQLAHVDTVRLASGARVVELSQAIDGVPVLDRGARVVVQADGRATRVTSSVEERRPATLVPSLDAKAAVAAAAKLGVPASSLGARLFVLPTGGEPRLVYGVVGDLGTLPTRPVVLLDAHTGELVMQWDAVKFAQKAKVYANNPVKTPTTTEVTLTNDTSKEGLQTDLVKAVNCIDKKSVKKVNFGVSLDVHTCDLVATVAPDEDGSGDYLSVVPEGDKAPEDSYAELSMFYHTERVFEFVKAKGLPESKIATVTAVANLRIPQGFQTASGTPDFSKIGNPELPLVPFDNAFFAEKDPLFTSIFGIESDGMWFGQGTFADFGYDGDVVYHEFGHYLVSRTLKLGGGFFADEHGLTASPGALNEGIADILSFFLTDDEKLGEYAAKGFALGGGGMRNAANAFKFPDSVTGEVHQDSEPVTAAVWAAYSTLDATKKDAFHKAFIDTLLTGKTGNQGYEDFAEALVETVSEDVDAATGAALKTAFESRGIKRGDPRVRTWQGTPLKSPVSQLGVHAPGKSEMGSKGDFAPGLYQVKVDAPGSKVRVTLGAKLLKRAAAGGGFGGPSGTPFAPAILAKIGGEPIKFTYGPTASDATTTADCTMDAAKTNATCVVELDLGAGGGGGAPAPVHVMLVNKGDQGGDFDNLTIATESLEDPGPVDPGPVDPGPGAAPASDSDGGCGCDVPGTSTGGATATFALAALGLAIAARRRRG